MLEKSLSRIRQSNSIAELHESVRQGIPSAIFGVPDSFKNYIVSTFDTPVLYVVKDGVTARHAVEEITQFSGKKTVYIPPKDEILLSLKAFSKDAFYQRLTALNALNDAQVIVSTLEALMQTAPSKIETITFVKGQDYEIEKAVRKLVEMGYQRRERCDTKATFSVRGDILDVYSIDATNPCRIDFFGDTVDSIRIYDAENTKTIEYVDQTTILQAVEFILSAQEKNQIKSTILEELKGAKGDKKLRLKVRYDDFLLAMENSNDDELSTISTICPSVKNTLDLLGENTVVVFNEGKRIYESCILYEKEFNERFAMLSKDGEIFEITKNNLLPLEETRQRLMCFKEVGLQTLSSINPFFNPLKIINPTVSAVSNYQLAFKEVFTDIDNWLRSNYSVLVCAMDDKKADRFCLELSDKGIASSIDKRGDFTGVNILSERLRQGFIFHEEKIAVIGSGNLFTKPPVQKKLKSKKQGFFNAPEVGDYCVHEVHGLGRVLGNKKISSQEGTKDYVSVEYAGGDILYIPVEQMDILTRYLGAEKKPRLSKIGGKDFEKVKRAVRESIKKMSFDLKKLYQERQEQKGFKFNPEQELQDYFEEAFPFEETPDQLSASEDIFSDMTSSKVMDRLVCGDVGFGKTEVAFRAVFRAIANGKQVAMLAPTTILVEQHYNTAVERFKDFGIKIACLNRFKTPKQQKQIVEDLKQGKIDFVIGTHRLLSKDIAFNDLGLLVLDEEQRFGVEHKEKIKLLKNNVDTLTLTATPIPRTLHMSLSGIRSISTINTPPKKRLPVQTIVTEETDALIKDAITREINRGGQAFILYNRVESINSFADRIKTIMPGLRITVVHGQMEERKLEQNILAFYRGESDVLVSTTIIENGIDLPRANTLVVIDADKLGLSTLYQIKGRVGRSDRLAYAYFTYKREKVLSTTAFDRLNAIIEFAEMGSGIKIAMRDLEIRGAGNILGAEQHGHMDKIGYELYSKLLKEELTGEEDVVPDLDIRVTAYIPDDYVENSTTRMDVYKEIAELSGEKDEEEIISSLKDTFGSIPEETQNLINIALVKRLASAFKVKEIVVKSGETYMAFDDFKALNNEKLLTALDCFGSRVKISMATIPKLEFQNKFSTNVQMLGVLREFLTLAHK